VISTGATIVSLSTANVGDVYEVSDLVALSSHDKSLVKSISDDRPRNHNIAMLAPPSEWDNDCCLARRLSRCIDHLRCHSSIVCRRLSNSPSTSTPTGGRITIRSVVVGAAIQSMAIVEVSNADPGDAGHAVLII